MKVSVIRGGNHRFSACLTAAIQGLRGQRGHGKTCMSALSVLIFSLFLSACTVSGDPGKSAWSIADDVVTEALNSGEGADGVSAQSAAYLTAEAKKKLNALRKQLGAVNPIGLVSLSDNGRGEWLGDFSYMIGKWPALARLTLKRKEGRTDQPWLIHNFPHFDAYTALASLVSKEDVNGSPERSSKMLPVTWEGMQWNGGLNGRDQRGRPLSNVLVVWIPPIAFIDGEPLNGVASRAQLSAKLNLAFEQRHKLAAAAQASYTPHVTLALMAEEKASRLIELISWCEGAGTERISLLARSADGPKLLYLSGRKDRMRLISPQRLVHAHLIEDDAHLTVMRTDREQREETEDRVRLLGAQKVLSEAAHDSNLRIYLSLMERARSRDALDGVSVHISESTSVSALVYFIDLSKQLDRSLPLAISPQKVEEGTKP